MDLQISDVYKLDLTMHKFKGTSYGKMMSMGFIYKIFTKRGPFSNIFRRGSFILVVSLLRLAKHAYRQLQLRNILQHHCSCTEKAKSIHRHVGFATTIGETHCACKHRSSHPSHGHACIHPP